MGEKGNITSDELVTLLQEKAAPSATEAVTSVVVNEAGVTVTQAGESLRDKLVDKTTDAAIEVVVERSKPKSGDAAGAPDPVADTGDDPNTPESPQ